jgi:hypothetical protein
VAAPPLDTDDFHEALVLHANLWLAPFREKLEYLTSIWREAGLDNGKFVFNCSLTVSHQGYQVSVYADGTPPKFERPTEDLYGKIIFRAQNSGFTEDCPGDDKHVSREDMNVIEMDLDGHPASLRYESVGESRGGVFYYTGVGELIDQLDIVTNDDISHVTPPPRPLHSAREPTRKWMTYSEWKALDIIARVSPPRFYKKRPDI